MDNLHDYVRLFFRALAFTVSVETAVLALFIYFRRLHGFSGIVLIRVLAAGVVASSVTLPAVWFVFPAVITGRRLFLVLAELCAFSAEVPILKGMVKTTWLEAASASLIANGASFIGGFLLRIS
jgi:hypothetical protein